MSPLNSAYHSFCYCFVSIFPVAIVVVVVQILLLFSVVVVAAVITAESATRLTNFDFD